MPSPPLLMLVRFLDDVLNQQWLIVNDGQYEGQSIDEAMEVTRLPLNDDLIMWMDAHREEVEAGEVNVFLEYRHSRRRR